MISQDPPGPIRLAAVFAHPDDDTFALAGTLSLEGERLEPTIIVATSGEAGPIADPSLSTRENLGAVREEEERAALAASGHPGATVHFLRFPDGGLPGAPREALVARVTELLIAARPHVVVGFGPEGVTRHPDHIAMHEVATDAFHRARAAPAAGDGGGEGDPGERGAAFQRLFYSVIPQSELERYFRILRSRGQDVDPEAPFMPRGDPDETVTVSVDCSSVLERKFEALRAHRTQAEEIEEIPEDLRPEIFGREWFAQAWPDPGRRRGPAPGLFGELLDDQSD